MTGFQRHWSVEEEARQPIPPKVIETLKKLRDAERKAKARVVEAGRAQVMPCLAPF